MLRTCLLSLGLILGALATAVPEANAFGCRLRHGPSITTCYTPCYHHHCCPIWPLWHPYYIHASLDSPTSQIPFQSQVKFNVQVTNTTCNWLLFRNSDYHYSLHDSFGHAIPNAILIRPLERHFWVPPHTSTLEQPPDVAINWDVLKPYHRYTLCVRLGCQTSCFCFVPILYQDGQKKVETRKVSDSPATVVVSLPHDAKLYVNGLLTDLTSSRREFSSPPLKVGQVYEYKLEARIERDGQVYSEKAKLKVEAGKESQIAFSEQTILASSSVSPKRLVSMKPTDSNVEKPAVLLVTLPDDAKLFIDGVPRDWKAAEGEFRTPPLKPGQDYNYMFSAEVIRNGERTQLFQTVTARAGKESSVIFEFEGDTKPRRSDRLVQK
jgi:uncharacterized protein (TIGR03000 family)